jgi:hypothetical protein
MRCRSCKGYQISQASSKCSYVLAILWGGRRSGTALCVGSCNRKACQHVNRGVGASTGRVIDSYCHGHGNASNESNTSVTTIESACQKNAATLADVRGHSRTFAVRKIPTRFGQLTSRNLRPLPWLGSSLQTRHLCPRFVCFMTGTCHRQLVLVRKATPTTTVASQSPATSLCSAFAWSSQGDTN